MKKKKLSKTKRQQRFQSYLWMLINTVVWGASFIFVKPALNTTTPIRYMFYRYVFAVILSLPILFHYLGKINNWMKKIITIALVELFGTTLGLSLLYTGLAQTSAIEASLLTISIPVMVTIGGILFLKEKEEKPEILGLILAILGTIILVLAPIISNHGIAKEISLTGNVLIITACIITAIYYIWAKKAFHNYPKFFVTAVSFYIGLISFGTLTLIELLMDPTQTVSSFFQVVTTDLANLNVWIASGYMALFGSIIGLTAYFKGQDGIEASEASLFTYLQPFVAIPLGIALLGEHVFSTQLIALAVIITGVFIAEKRWK